MRNWCLNGRVGNGDDHPLPGESRPWLTIGVTAVMFLGGAPAGLALARWFAPGSPVAEFVAFLVLPLSFVCALVLWQGFTLLVLLLKLIAGGLKKRTQPQEAVALLRRKAALMIPVPVVFCVPAGLIVGWLGDGVLAAMGGFSAVGLIYGLGLYALAQKDLLPLLEPE